MTIVKAKVAVKSVR